MSEIGPIRLILFDIDGVLTFGEAKPLDLELLGRLAHMNHLARADPTRPAVTLCTGRPAPYVEVMLQAIDGHVPGIYENGAGLYIPADYQFVPHPLVEGASNLRMVRQRLEEGLVRSGRAFFQPGKEHSLTLFAHNPAETNRLETWAATALGSLRESVELVYSTSCLNVLPRGVNKGKGVELLAERTGYAPEEMLGVGDSDVDLQFLALVDHSAAPANAIPEIKRLVQYVAPRQASDGVRDILDHFGLG